MPARTRAKFYRTGLRLHQTAQRKLATVVHTPQPKRAAKRRQAIRRTIAEGLAEHDARRDD